MKLATFRFDGPPRVGVVDPAAGRIWPADELADEPIADMLQLIRSWARLRERLAPRGPGLELSRVTLEAPIPRPPRNVLCVGKNYRAHAHEFTRSGYDSSAKGAADAVPTAPVVFTKAPETVIGPDQPIRYPDGVSEQVDYEAELAVVLGTAGRGIRPEDAQRHVFGYTIVNDVTARDLQARHKQWFLGKSLDTFCPMGPWIVTADEIDLAAGLEVRCWVNGELRQQGDTRDLVFDLPTLLAALSAGLTLQQGDVLATGTPAGVGIGFDPPRFLRRGDRVRIAISGIGVLENEVV
ncbi:MAG TPA: fumarylacetoacetate hydrolase family protein [Anaeromyxobacteraceae bacterium]|nr:fumarylacetoacetate hydrolase family protein [Anaeromyxobacteraceae bacterium]